MILDTERLQTDIAYGQDLRHRFVTDHFFAAEVLGHTKFVRHLHQPAVDLYFPKNPNIPIEDQDPIHNRMHLDPRGTFKTTLNRVDKVQWYAAFPTLLTCLTQSATTPLAEAISASIVRPFWRPKGRSTTVLQALYPELVFEKKPSGEWNNPEHEMDSDLDSTLAFTSPLSTQSGWHPYVMNIDDIEDTKNSGISAAQEVRQGVIDTYDQNENLLRGGGFIYIVGTRYFPFDLYGKKLASMDPSRWKVLIRQTMTVKSGAKLVPGEFPAEDDVIMHFAELRDMDYHSMREKFIQNFEAFQCQQQNDPQGGNIPTFDEKLYASCAIAPERVPQIGWQGGQTFTCWRPKYSGKPGMARHLEGACARIIDGKVYVIDTWQSTRTPSGEAELIVQAQKEHQSDGVMIIGVPGSDHMAHHIRNEAARRNISVKIQWLYFEEDDSQRNAGIKQLEPLMKVGRVLFATDMSKSAECRKQFVHYGLVPETGIIECISRLADMVPISQMRANMQEEELEYQRRSREDAMLQSFMVQQGMPAVDEQAKQQTEAHLNAMSNAQNWMPPLPGGLDG